MEILYINNYDKNAFTVEKFNESKFNLKYKSKNFIINPKIAFENCSLWSEKLPYKTRINIDCINEEHIDFEDLINTLYNEVNKYRKKNKDITANIVYPLINSSILENTKILYISVNKSTTFEDFDTKEKINIEFLKYKRFTMYPLIYSPNINIYNDVVYINFMLKSAYIKIEELEVGTDDVVIDYNDVINAFNKYNRK